MEHRIIARKASLEDMLQAVRDHLGQDKTLISKPSGIYGISGCGVHYVRKAKDCQYPHWQLVRVLA